MQFAVYYPKGLIKLCLNSTDKFNLNYLLTSFFEMRFESQREETKLAENRVYEVMYIADPATDSDAIQSLNKDIEELVESQGGKVVNTDDMGKRQLAYKIKQFTEGYYFLFEIEGSGSEIAELERRMRVNDKIFRYLTVRVDEERKTAAKIEAKREKRKEKLSSLLSKRTAEEGESQEDN